jgi:hypothetical protein
LVGSASFPFGKTKGQRAFGFPAAAPEQQQEKGMALLVEQQQENQRQHSRKTKL